MKVIRKINNNAAVCVNSIGNEIVAIGKGIGFPQMPYDLDDLNIIERTYYDINPIYLDLLNQIPNEIFMVSSKIVELFRDEVDSSVSSNLVFTLADHINFAIVRFNKKMVFDNPLHYEVQHMYEKEYAISLKALEIIRKDLGVKLPKEEISNISIHLINAESVSGSPKATTNYNEVLNDITDMISQYFNIYIDKGSINYSRFVSHIQYLFKRIKKSERVSSENLKLFESVKDKCPKEYECVLRIVDYLKTEFDADVNEEEMLYLILHVNRLCDREDCNRKGITPAQ